MAQTAICLFRYVPGSEQPCCPSCLLSLNNKALAARLRTFLTSHHRPPACHLPLHHRSPAGHRRIHHRSCYHRPHSRDRLLEVRSLHRGHRLRKPTHTLSSEFDRSVLACPQNALFILHDAALLLSLASTSCTHRSRDLHNHPSALGALSP